ncbi:MAG TPA: polyketide synthase docking domain-containing protein, partial [Pyrinomonadaceae bacterium]|nr:polyketide synthase docking domain-containing protein [Pyrinomonadaceae bacterium]
MATIRTEREIRQRAPWWLLGLLFMNLALMTFDARDDVTKQRLIRVWVQAVAAPFQRVSSGAGDASVGFFQRLANLRNATAENEQLRQQVEQMEIELRTAREALDENERLKSLLDLKETGA